MKKFSVRTMVLIIMAMLVFTAAIVQGSMNPIKTGMVSGQLGIKGVGPMLGATVYFFDKTAGPPPSPTRYWRVPTYVFTVDDNVRFKAELPVGEYYMGAIERLSGEPLGPPQEGEYFFINQDRKGRPRTIAVKANKKLDMGMITAAKPFSRASLVMKDITAIEGTILNDKGVPVEGILVLGFSTPSTIGRPLFVSERSGKDGRYQLRVSGGGKYYLRARAAFGGPPAADELMGVYKDGKAVSVKTGAVKKDIDITVAVLSAAAPPQP